jgi:hypothetical protein
MRSAKTDNSGHGVMTRQVIPESQSEMLLERGSTKPSLSERFYFGAVAALPLQAGFAIPVGGTTLQVPQVLLLLAVFALPFGWSTKNHGKPKYLDSIYVAAIVVATFCSALLAFIFTVPNSSVPGINDPKTDLIAQTGNIVFILIAWMIGCRLPGGAWRRALTLSVWVALFGVIFQLILGNTGNLTLLENLGFHTKAAENAVGLSTLGLREGTFYNGQDLGFFSAAAILIALKYRKLVTAFAGAFCLYYSQSTTGYVALIAAVIILIFVRFSLRVFAIVICLLVAFVGLLVASPTARQVFDEQTVKLGISGTSVEDAGDSLELRTLKSDIALEIFKSSPVFGVGPGEYGVSFWNVQESADAPAYYSAEDHRAIVENVYAQVLAELGVVGFLSFAMLMLWYFARLRRVSAIDLALLIAILVGLTTQGSWIGVPVWILLAYLSSTIRNDGKSLKRSNVAGDNTEYPHSSSLRCMTK